MRLDLEVGSNLVSDGEEVFGAVSYHARPSQPFDPDPILTPPDIAPLALHDTAALCHAKREESVSQTINGSV